MMTHIHPKYIRKALANQPPPQGGDTKRTQAAVAMLLHGASPGEIFFIVRSKHEKDPWSGDIGFPGGKIERDESVRETAERETLEEVSIDLSSAERLGYLEPISGAHLPVEISCAVYYLREKPRVQRNQEVSNTFWYRIDELLSPEKFGTYPVRFGNERLTRPGIRLLPENQPILWGITYRLLEQFFNTMKMPFPSGGT